MYYNCPKNPPPFCTDHLSPYSLFWLGGGGGLTMDMGSDRVWQGEFYAADFQVIFVIHWNLLG